MKGFFLNFVLEFERDSSNSKIRLLKCEMRNYLNRNLVRSFSPWKQWMVSMDCLGTSPPDSMKFCIVFHPSSVCSHSGLVSMQYSSSFWFKFTSTITLVSSVCAVEKRRKKISRATLAKRATVTYARSIPICFCTVFERGRPPTQTRSQSSSPIETNKVLYRQCRHKNEWSFWPAQSSLTTIVTR